MVTLGCGNLLRGESISGAWCWLCCVTMVTPQSSTKSWLQWDVLGPPPSEGMVGLLGRAGVLS